MSSLFSFASPQTSVGETVFGDKWNYLINYLKRTQPVAATVSKDGTTYYAYKANGDLISSSSSDAGTVINAACSFVGTIGGIVKIKAETYSVVTQIQLPSNVIISGEGRNVTKLISTSALATNMIRNSDETNGNTNLGVEHLYLNHSAGTGGVALKCTKVSQSFWRDNYITGNSASFACYWTAGTSTANDNLIMNNIFDGGGINNGDIFGGGKLTDSVVAFNTVKGGGPAGGGIVQRLPLRTLFIGNTATGIRVGGIIGETARHCMFAYNKCHDSLSSSNGIGATTSLDGDAVDCTFIGNVCYLNTSRGISAVGKGHQFIGNRCELNGINGIEFSGNDCIAVNNICKNNGTDTSVAIGFRVGIRIPNVQNCIVTGNRCYDDQGVPTQQYGINEVGTSNNNMITGNICTANVTAQLAFVGAATIRRNNIGYVTEAQGIGSITSAATSATITHGLSYTPTPAEITINFTENPDTSVGTWWISPVPTSTQFVVNVEVAPGASNLDFSWSVRRI